MGASRPGRGLAAMMLTGGLLATAASSGGAGDAARPRGPRAPAVKSERWVNSKPLSALDLQGKVVLVEFWTFGCINCVRTIPAMRKLHAALPDRDVAIVSVHTPEFDHERSPENVEQAVARLGVRYPVAIDNDYRVWRAFKNRYWPALYVVDRRGVIRHTHIGELHEGTPAWDRVLELIEELRKEST